jgi:3-oxoisoapionate decarboxylase
MTRRQILAAAALAPLQFATAQTQPRSRMGGAPTAFSLRMRAARQEGKPFDVVEHCHSIGLSAAETSLRATGADFLKDFRHRVEEYNMRVVLNVPLPKTEADVAAFDTAVSACKEAGAFALHAAMTARRYEQFDSFATWKRNFEQCQQSVAFAEPVLRKHRMPLAIENHKGWRAAEQAAWMKRVSSEWVGVCLDFGNNLSLCETPEQTLQALAPFTLMTHIKDMGLQDYKDGFLLSEVVFGDGVSNLKQMVQTLRAKDPNMLFLMEMITRDPLRVPVYTEKYWATFDDSSSPIPARDLARVLELVRANPPKKPLPVIAGLNPADQVKAEDNYNLQCIAYARQQLEL